MEEQDAGSGQNSDMLERLRITLKKHQLILFILIFISASLIVVSNTLFTRTVEVKSPYQRTQT